MSSMGDNTKSADVSISVESVDDQSSSIPPPKIATTATEPPLSKKSRVDPRTDPYGYLGLVRNPDGSDTRKSNDDPKTPISSYNGSPTLLVKDITVNESKNTWARVFLPKEAINSSPAGRKFPLLIYIHGGGFVICNVATPLFDKLYRIFTPEIPVMLVSIEYRRAPEHRLPAAYEDCLEDLHWIKNSKDEWFTKYADFSNTFLMGSSAGGNIAYFIGLRASVSPGDLKPLNIKGVILNQPFFGGVKRTRSELRNANDKVLPTPLSDLMWELALPVGSNRDHEFCNPILNYKKGQFNHIKALGWKILVTGYYGDPLFDRQVELVKMLEENGLPVLSKFDAGGYHGIDTAEWPNAKALSKVVKYFVESNIATLTV
ncbi:hypothetical protein ACH5RR_038977 [Cinchona calisaya]|uniref:Alpha/beta hydrolase fold-3 domain-containing protein n=1 Tax=Cinchona calisaya TaxID=153742 RepID=A0ABD2Y0C1_9GENT